MASEFNAEDILQVILTWDLIDEVEWCDMFALTVQLLLRPNSKFSSNELFQSDTKLINKT